MMNLERTRFQKWNLGIIYNYKTETTLFRNSNFENTPWIILEDWFIHIGLYPKLFEYDNFYYDGHTVRAITICGLRFSHGYSYDSHSVETWLKDTDEH